MHRAAKLVTPLLAAAAVSILTGCRPKEMQRCVDEHNNVVADNLCNGQSQQRVEQRSDGHGGFFPFFIPMYRPYFGGYGGGIGSSVGGGSYAPVPGHSYSAPGKGFFGSSGSVTRGGFGSSFGGEGVGE